MTDLFGAAAARISGQVAVLLGWAPAAFWDATPEEVAAVLTAAAPPAAGGMDRAALAALIKEEADGHA